MSYPANPLDKYQAYSYHHFLIAANNTEVLRQIQSNEISFESLSRLKHGETVGGADGSVVMVLNSVVDSKFYIESVNYSSVYVSVSDPTAMMTQATEMDMIVKETGGATFINFLRDVSDKYLETSYDSVCFMLKTFFVGHDSSGGTSHYETQPIMILLKNMDSSFDYSGGVHTIKFLGLTNGAPVKSDATHYVPRSLNLVTSDNSILLKDLITDLEKKLNALLDEQWKAVQKATGGNGRRVKYKFTIPKDWDNYKVKSTSKDNYIERLFEKEKPATTTEKDSKQNNSGQQNKPGIESDRFKTNMNTAVKTTITQILSEIFKHCDEIQAAFAENQKGGQKMPKLHQVVSSVTSDKQLVTIHFDIVNYYLPKLPSATEKPAVQKVTEEQKKAANDAAFDKYGITYDYIFTGKNSDILQLDMKANHTNIVLIANQTGIQKATGNMTATDNSVQSATQDNNAKADTKKVTTAMPVRKNDAIFLSDISAPAEQGYIYKAPDSAELHTKYVNTLALLAANTARGNMHIVVRGNPVFMNQIVRPIFPHNDDDYDRKIREMEKKAEEIAHKGTGEYDTAMAISYMGQAPTYVPQFVKVNIKTPIFDDRGNITGFEDFWYQGRYRVTKIKNSFSNGQFTQELYLLPYELEGQ